MLLCEVEGSRKETRRAATGTMRLCLFSLWVDLGERRRCLQGCPLKNVCQAFIETANIYSGAGIPWMWFTCCCLDSFEPCVKEGNLATSRGWIRGDYATLDTWTSIALIWDFFFSVGLSQTLSHGRCKQLFSCWSLQRKSLRRLSCFQRKKVLVKGVALGLETHGKVSKPKPFLCSSVGIIPAFLGFSSTSSTVVIQVFSSCQKKMCGAAPGWEGSELRQFCGSEQTVKMQKKKKAETLFAKWNKMSFVTPTKLNQL